MTARNSVRILAGAIALTFLVGCSSTQKNAAVNSGTPVVVMRVHSGDSFRGIVPADIAGIQDAVIISSTNSTQAGMRTIRTIYLNKATTRHLVLTYYPETGETQCYTFINVRLHDIEAADPNTQEGYLSRAFFASNYLGQTLYVTTVTTCQFACVIGTACTETGASVGQQMIAAGKAKPGTGNAQDVVAKHNGTDTRPCWSYNVVDEQIAGKPTGPVGTMPAAAMPEQPAELPAAETNKTEAAAAEGAQPPAEGSQPPAAESPFAGEAK